MNIKKKWCGAGLGYYYELDTGAVIICFDSYAIQSHGVVIDCGHEGCVLIKKEKAREFVEKCVLAEVVV